jgi:DNA repair photolyase
LWTNTDPYQRCEGKYHLTQGVIGVLAEVRNPFSILTKSTLVLRDLDLLARAAARTEVGVNLSIGTLDEQVWRLTEPGTPAPRRRVEAVRRLNDAGVPCGVLVAPILPGLSDRPEQLEEVVAACVGAGAISVSAVALHLRPGVREHYLGWLQEARPDLVPAYRRSYRTAYLPGAEQRALAERVAALVGAARSKLTTGGLLPRPARPGRPDEGLPPEENGTQLQFGF